MFNPVSNLTQTEKEIIKSDSKTIVRKGLIKGAKPSLDQIDKWFKNGLTVNVTNSEGGHQIKGRITQIGPYRSDTNADALIWIENHPFEIYVRNINHFEVEEIKEISFPMILDPCSEFAKKIQTVTLISNGEKFVVNQERICEEIPYFKAMLHGGFKESIQNEKDVSESLSPQQLKLILLYLDGQVQIEESNVIDLFIISDALFINELNHKVKEYLVKNLTLEEIQLLRSNVNHPLVQDFLNDINNEIIKSYPNQHFCPVGQEINRLLKEKKSLNDVKQLSLECRKIIYSVYSSSKPHLGSDGIIDVLRLAEILGATIESLNIYNVNDPDLPLLVEYLKRNPQIISLNISWNNIRRVDDSLTDKGASLLAETINSLSALKTLKIRDHNISDKGLKLIADALEFNTSLKVVDLSYNKFSSEGFDYLAEKLKMNKTIKTLCLTGCGIGTELKKNGKYVQAFSANTSLRELYIGNNCIDDEGAEGISEIINSNTSLQVIDLWGNRISLEGRKKLVASLQNNETLTKVRVNNVDSEQDRNNRPASIALRGNFS